MNPTRRSTLVACAFALAGAGHRAARAQASFAGKQLVAQGFGGLTQDVIQRAVLDPFDARTGAHSTQVPLQSAAALARMRAEAAQPQLDLYQFSGGQERQASSEGLLAPLDGVPGLDALPAGLRGRDWTTYAVIAQGILYRTDKLREPPRSYQDLLRPELDGHVAFPTITNGYGMDLLVMLARAGGGGEANIDPGMRALAKLAPNASIFKAAGEVPTLFAQADAWVVPYDSATALRCAEAGLPVAFAAPAEGSPSVPITTCVAAKSANLDVARAAVGAFLLPDSQAALAEKLGWAPTNPGTRLPDAVARRVPKLDQLVTLDRGVINANQSAWTDRWNREVAR